MSIVSMPMYEPAGLGAATDALYAALRTHLVAAGIRNAPHLLTRPPGRALASVWTSPVLLFAQTCGYPLVTGLAGRVRVVGTPAYAAEGCEGIAYSSAIVVRRDDPSRAFADLEGRVAAINSRDSHSGMNAFRGEIPDGSPSPFFARVIATGSHAASVRAVALGEADAAAIDAVTFALLSRERPADTEGVRVLSWSRRAPGLPFVTAATTDDATLEALRRAFVAFTFDPDPEVRAVRARLLWSGFRPTDERTYASIAAVEADALAKGKAL